MAATALSAVLGFGREIASAHYYGTRAEMDAFINASTIPTVLFGVFNGALVSALVPTFSEYMSKGESGQVRRLGSTVVNILLFTMTALAGLGWLLAPYFVPIVAHGFPPAEQGLVVTMVRWLMPGIIATSLSGVCAALLNANHRFAASAYVTAAANLVTLMVVVLFFRQLGIFALVLGTVLGLFAQLLVQLPSILRYNLYRLELDLRHPGLAKALGLLIPVTVGSGASQINLAFDRYFASTLTAGSTAGMNYVNKLALLPVIIVSGAIGTVVFPLIAGQFASSDHVGVRRSASLSLRMISFTVIPCAAGLSVLAYPIVQTLFERGAFGPNATALCASFVPFACIPLLAGSYSGVLSRACYACKEVRLAVVGSFSAVAINIALSATFLPRLGARGLLLANGIAGFFLVTYLIALLWRLIGGFDWKPIVLSSMKVISAAFAMAAALYTIRLQGWLSPSSSLFSRAWHLCALLTIAAIIYLAVARMMGVEELSIAIRIITKRLTRRSPISETVSVT